MIKHKNNTTNSGQLRYTELDALRGIAAVSVVFWHLFCTAYIGDITTNKVFVYSLYILFQGRAAVILFFILSGFVLSLPFFKEPRPHYLPFISRRICRIYLPYIVGIGTAIIVRSFVTVKPIPNLSNWFNEYCGTPFSLKFALEHLFLIGNIHSNLYNNSIWTLIHELRLSFLFPLIFLFVKRVNPLISIVTCFLLSSIAQLNVAVQWETSNGWQSGYFDSLHVASLFIIGILLARYKDLLIKFYKQRGKAMKVILFLSALFLFRAPMEFWVRNLDNVFFDYGSALGACGFMVISLGSAKASIILNKPFFRLLGNISYSLYLYHIIILYLAFYLLYPFIPIPVLSIIIVVSLVVFSFFSWKYIELPSITLGRVLSKRIAKK